MEIKRRETRKIFVGNVPVGGDAPVSVQTMTKTFTHHKKKTLEQIKKCHSAGCDIIRVAVPDEKSVRSFEWIKKNSPIPVVADIHFNYKLAIDSISAGADCVRINPGNIGGERAVEMIVKRAEEAGIPLRIGVNAGSLERDVLEKFGSPSPEALSFSAEKWCRFLEEKLGFKNFKVSIKSTDPMTTVRANILFSSRTDAPLHIGITESGTSFSGGIRSAVGLTILLSSGIGDTIRVSLPTHPVFEVLAGIHILNSLGLRRFEGVKVIACPVCGRCQVNVQKIADEIERRTIFIKKPITVAVMGCVVNGPGEARLADIGVVGGKNSFLLYIKGKKVKKVEPRDLLKTLMKVMEEEFLKK
jgi:(E)-4-hydroxy-3-methylbut-2-enyl-diphosphate synthase